MSTSNPVPPPGYYQPQPRSIFGPLVLISLGILLLLLTTKVVPGSTIAWWFAHYWPVLLVIWGVAKLIEHIWARQHGQPSPRLGGGAITFLIFFILCSMSFSKATGVNWSAVRTDLNIDPDWDWGWGSHYDFTDSFDQPLAGGTQVNVVCNRADITVTASDDDQVHAQVHKTISGESQDTANKLNESTKAKFTQQGSIWLLDLTGGDYEHTKFELDLQLPRKLALSLSTHHGNLSVTERDGNVDLSTDHGNVSVDQIKGNTNLHLSGDVSIKQVTGNVQVDGAVDDGSIADVGGTLDFDAGYTGNLEIARVAQQLHLKSRRTDLQLARLEGELNLGHGDLRGESVAGPVKLSTSANEVHFEDISGQISIENRNGVVELKTKAPLGPIDINNVHGGIELALPDKASFRMDAESRSGNIEVNDFSLTADNSRRDSTLRGSVGNGGPDIRLRADRGSIEIHKQ